MNETPSKAPRMKAPLDLTKTYKTRDGRAVTLWKEQTYQPNPCAAGYQLIGIATEANGYQMAFVWNLDGTVFTSGDDVPGHYLDLVAVPEETVEWLNYYPIAGNRMDTESHYSYTEEAVADRSRTARAIKVKVTLHDGKPVKFEVVYAPGDAA